MYVWISMSVTRVIQRLTKASKIPGECECDCIDTCMACMVLIVCSTLTVNQRN